MTGPHRLLPKSGRSKRHMNMIASVALCAGLMIAFYLSVGQGHIDTDTHITLERHDCAFGCPAYQVDVLANGATVYQGRSVTGLNGIYRYKLSKFAVRRMLRVFDRARFFDLKVNGYAVDPAKPVCTLTLTSGRQKMSVRHSCNETALEIAKPISAVELATRVADIAKGRVRATGLHPAPTTLAPNDVVRPLAADHFP